MIGNKELKRVLDMSRHFAQEGLISGARANIPEITIALIEQGAFIGVGKNPAIFVTQNTYRMLGRANPDWQPDQTIAIKRSFIERAAIVNIIGVLAHETGHAFNVYAGISNSENNAYVFEIEAMMQFVEDSSFMARYGLKLEDYKAYFESRMRYYRMGAKVNECLQGLLPKIERGFLQQQPPMLPNSQVRRHVLFFEKLIGCADKAKPKLNALMASSRL